LCVLLGEDEYDCDAIKEVMPTATSDHSPGDILSHKPGWCIIQKSFSKFVRSLHFIAWSQKRVFHNCLLKSVYLQDLL